MSEHVPIQLFEAWSAVFGEGAPFRWHDRELAIEADGYRELAIEADGYRERHACCAAFSFAVPCEKALELIASYGPVVEIGAGTGYWAKLLRERGVDVVAYDSFGDSYTKWFPTGGFGGVTKGTHKAAARHPDRTLLLVWPPMSSMAHDALRAYEAAGGQRIVYVGEGMGGCTADDGFFGAVDDCYRCEYPDIQDEPCGHGVATWREVEALPIPQWSGINDYLAVFERRGGGSVGERDAP